MMHVLISEDLIDREYIEKYTLGYEELRKRVLENHSPAWAAQICGITVDEVVQLAREYGSVKPAAIRLNYGMQRHAGGGIAARTIACLPALTGRVARGGGRHRADHGGLLPLRPCGARAAGSARRPPAARHQPFRAWRRADRGRSAGARDARLQQQSGRGMPGLGEGDRRVLARGPVHRRHGLISRPIPRTTPTSCCPRRRSSSTTTCTSPTATCTCSPTTRRSRRSASRCRIPRYSAGSPRAWASTIPASATPTRTCAARRCNGKSWETLKQSGWQKLDVPERFAPFAQGGFPTPSGKCEFRSAWLEKQGIDPLPFYNPPAEAGDAALEKKYPARLSLAAGAPLPQFHLRQRRALPGIRERAAPRPAPAGRRGARHRRR